MTAHTSGDILALIRAKMLTGGFCLSDAEAILLLDLYASVAATRAERDMLADAASAMSDRTQRVIILGDHSPEYGASA